MGTFTFKPLTMEPSAGQTRHIRWLTKPAQLHQDVGHTQRAAGLRQFVFSFPTSHRNETVRLSWSTVNREAQGWVSRNECRIMAFLISKCFFSKFKHIHREGNICVSKSAHRKAKSSSNANTHSRAPTAFQVPDWAIWDCHFCRLKMVRCPPQKCS